MKKLSFRRSRPSEKKQTTKKEAETTRKKRSHIFPRRSNRSRIGAAAMAVLSVAFIALSYIFPGVIFELNSVIAFIAAVVLLFKDQNLSVQTRVIDRIMSSSEGLVTELSSRSYGHDSYRYVPDGSSIADVAIVPFDASENGPIDFFSSRNVDGEQARPAPEASNASSSSSSTSALRTAGLQKLSHVALQLGPHPSSLPANAPSPTVTQGVHEAQSSSEHEQAEPRQQPPQPSTTIPSSESASIPRLIPPGRALAELFYRELDTEAERPSPDEVVDSMPEIIVHSFGLASSAGVAESDGIVYIRMIHPVFHHSCNLAQDARGNAGVIGCGICSFIAVLFCHSTRRVVALGGCSYDEESDTSTIALALGDEYPPKASGENQLTS